MMVKELIALLEEQDPDADVLIMSQQSWPFENAVYGVCSRDDLADRDDDDDEYEDDEGAPADVFIVEGSQLRYGSKRAWNVAQR